MARRSPSRAWRIFKVRLPFDTGDWYAVYDNTGAGDPVDYGTPLVHLQATTWTTSPLSPGTWKFGVRASNANGEEKNLDCAVLIVLDSLGNDITNRPMPSTGLRAFATAAGGIRVEWFYPPTRGAKAPTGFHVYQGTGGTPNYGEPVATVSYATGILNTFVANLSGLTGGTTYTIGVRAYNTVGEEANIATVSAAASTVGPDMIAGLTVIATV